MKFLWQYVLVVAALIVGSVLLAGCGGGGGGGGGGGEEELDLDQYFRRVEEIMNEMETRSKKLEEYEGAGQEIEATRDYVDAVEGITRQALNDLKDLHPPAEARDAHDEFVGGVSQMLALWEDLSDGLADVESPSELQAVLAEDSASDAVLEQVDNACRQLQGIADENGIEVDVRCD
jgi:hypothetical protein